MRVVGLFSGIGGLELPFAEHGANTELMCEIWGPAQTVLRARFPGVEVKPDITKIRSLPQGTDVVTAGFPCTDLSQAGRTAGIQGRESGLVSNVFRLLRNRRIEWVVLENVRNMLVLDRGRAMHYLTAELEGLGFKWAYRLVDSRFSGVPQRRHRVLMVASRNHDPGTVLFADDDVEPVDSEFSRGAAGFYWTEGARGLGWALDAVPPLKGGSTVGIPSPPAIWMPSAKPGMRLVTPCIEDAEALQGFERGWTAPAESSKSNGPRWKLVGNAVTVGVSRWLVGRLHAPGPIAVDRYPAGALRRWPDSAAGAAGTLYGVRASTWPRRVPYTGLMDLLTADRLRPLSFKATNGFWQRASNSSLRFEPGFLDDVRRHADLMLARESAGRRKKVAA
jgi:DNA (cytosine-5)-methyltransferase 1